MATTPMTPEERLARLEGVYDHLATKADLADLKAEFKSDLARVDNSLAELKGSFRTLLIAVTSGLALLNIILRFWPA